MLLQEVNNEFLMKLMIGTIIFFSVCILMYKLVRFGNRIKELRRRYYEIYLRHSKALLIFVLGLTVFSCQSKFEDGDTIEGVTAEEIPYRVNNNSGTLSNRITYINRTATISPLVSGLNTSRSTSSDVNGAQEMYYWEHVAEVAPLVIDGVTLSATHITLNDDKAYVSYHRQGNNHTGAVEIIDLANANFPSIISQAYFDKSDINAVTSGFTNGSSNLKVWLAMSDATHGAQLYELETTGYNFTENFRRVNLSNIIDGSGVSASANGIAVTDNYLYVTSGKTYGGTVLLNKNDLTPVAHESYRDAKYVAANGTSNGSGVVSLVTGDNAAIKVGTVEADLNTTSYNIGSIFHQNVVETYRGKSTMEFSPINNNHLYIAKGKDGIAMVDITSGNILNESKGTMLVVGNTNGVTTDGDYIYAANGSDGISIAPHPTSAGEDIVPFFHWDMAEDDASANYIIADGEWVFVAKGGGGFKILRKRTKDQYKTITTYNNNGVPDGMEEDEEICSELLPNIYANVLPERQNAMVAHPEYFSNPVKNLVISEETELYLTFVDEGAGYKNVLGYYTYQEGNIPTSEEQLDKIVIFPNASAQGSGGGLIRGNTMRLLGTFEPGTVISFFVIANGWRNGQITDGYYTQHTDIDFNLSGRQQSIIFYDRTCNSTVIAFEDISVPNGDNDFNDAIFQITSSNPNAIATDTFVQIND